MNIEFNLQQVTENTVMGSHEEGRSNAGAVIMDDFIVAMDCTMWPHTARLFRQALEDKFNKPVKYLFVTHSHGDHMMGLTAFKDVTIFGCDQFKISIPRRMETEWTAEQMAERKAASPEAAASFDEIELFIPTALFHQQMTIVNNDQSIEFHHSGGHTDDSSWAYYPAEKVLFAGDLIFSNWFPYAGDNSCDPEQWITILRTWLDMSIDKVVPGHGPVMGIEIIEKTLSLYNQLKQNTLEVVSRNGTPEEIIIPDVFEINADLNWLIERTRNHWLKFYSNNVE